MLHRLLESNRPSAYSPSQLATSVAAHTLIIALAVYATAQASGGPRDDLKPVIIPLRYEHPAPTQPSLAVKAGVGYRGRRIPNVVSLPRTLTVSSVALPVFESNDLPFSKDAGIHGLNASTAALSGDVVYTETGVETPAAPLASNRHPEYPEQLRIAGVEGGVRATFVIDTTGRVEGPSIRFASKDNDLFVDAVRTALLRMTFSPARIAGRKVRQLVEMPFVFRINR